MFSRWRRWRKCESALRSGSFGLVDSLYPDAVLLELDVDRSAKVLFRAIECGELGRFQRLLDSNVVVGGRLFRDFELVDFAVDMEDRRALQMLIASGAPVNPPILTTSMPPLHHASRRLLPEIVEFLIAANADVNARGSTGETPLMAAFMGYDEMSEAGVSRLRTTIRTLLDQGADPTVRNNKNFGPMHCAATVGDMPCIEMLADRGASLDVVSENHVTPLVLAAGSGNAVATKYFLAHGAVFDVTFSEGHNLVDLCRNKGRHDTAKIIEDALRGIESGRSDSVN